MAWAMSAPWVSATTDSARSMPAETPAAVHTLPPCTNRCSVGVAPYLANRGELAGDETAGHHDDVGRVDLIERMRYGQTEQAVVIGDLACFRRTEDDLGV